MASRTAALRTAGFSLSPDGACTSAGTTIVGSAASGSATGSAGGLGEEAAHLAKLGVPSLKQGFRFQSLEVLQRLVDEALQVGGGLGGIAMGPAQRFGDDVHR